MKYFNLPEKIETLIFDIDSTLYTNEAYAFEQIDCQVRHLAKLRGISDDECRHLVAQKRKEYADSHDGQKISLGNVLVGLGVSIEDSIKWRNELYNPSEYLSFDQQLEKKMRELKEKYKIICVTNNPTFVARKTLEVIGISPFVEHIVGLDTCKKSKPAKEIFLKAMELTDSIPETSVSVGDRFDIDLKLPLEMGMGGILVDGVEDVYKIFQ